MGVECSKLLILKARASGSRGCVLEFKIEGSGSAGLQRSRFRAHAP